MSTGRNGKHGGQGAVSDEPRLPAPLQRLPDMGDALTVRTLPKGGELEREIATSVLLGDDRGAEVLKNIRFMASRRQRSAQWASLYAEIVGWRGTKEQVIAFVVSQLGCSVDDAREAVEQLERVPKEPQEIYASCKAYCDWYEATYGEAV